LLCISTSKETQAIASHWTSGLLTVFPQVFTITLVIGRTWDKIYPAVNSPVYGEAGGTNFCPGFIELTLQLYSGPLLWLSLDKMQ